MANIVYPIVAALVVAAALSLTTADEVGGHSGDGAKPVPTAPSHATSPSPSASNTFLVQGRVYCDTCRVKFETKLTEYIQGAKVKLECRKRTCTDKPVTLKLEGETDKNGVYVIPVDGDRPNELCEVHLLSSPRNDCNEIMDGGRDRATVMLSKNIGMKGFNRFANSLGYMKKSPLPECANILTELGFIPDTTNLITSRRRKLL